MSAVRDVFVYRMYADDLLLYIGITSNLDRRWREHRGERPGMTNLVTRCHVSGPYTRDTAKQLERTALIAEDPLLAWTPMKQSAKQRGLPYINGRSPQFTRRCR